MLVAIESEMDVCRSEKRIRVPLQGSDGKNQREST